MVVRGVRGDIATLQVEAGSRVQLDLPAGLYTVEDRDRGGRVSLSVDPGAVGRFQLTATGAQGTSGGVLPGEAGSGRDIAHAPMPPPKGPSGKRIAAPVMSALIPGTGQMINGQPGKGVGILLGTAVLAAGSLLLVRTGGGTAVSTPGLRSSSFGGEAISAAGYGVLTGGLQMLYAAQVMDAYATAVGRRVPRPRTNYRVSLEVTRMATIGLRPGDPAAGFFPDWNIGMLGQVTRRLSVGITDMSIKQGQRFVRTTLQGGLRIHYRFFDRGRIWLGGAAGMILQGSYGRPPPSRADTTDTPTAGQGSFALVPYGQLDMRVFILDRWSLNFTPRVSAPLMGPRFFNGGDRGDRAVPRQAVTLELGTGVGVYF